MKLIISLFVSIITFLSFGFANVEAASDSPFDPPAKVSYCDEDGECGLLQGIKSLYNKIEGLIYDRPFSEWIQDVVVYLLSFLTLIAVLYIIYAGFNLLTGNGDEEKLKKTKNIIIYVIIGIVIIWLAYPIATWLFTILG